MINFFTLPSLIFGSLFLLTSCVSLQAPIEKVPNKAFHYSYQNPSRVLLDKGFAKQLSNGKQNSTARIKFQNNRLSTARLGGRYFSASGHECRKYKVLPHHEYAACHINGRWYNASPIIISNK